MNEEIKEEVISNLTNFEDMADSIEQSLVNLKNVIEQQKLLLNIIETSEHKDKFEQFISESKEQLTNLQTQKENLENKHNLIIDLCNICKDNESNTNILDLICNILGLFK